MNQQSSPFPENRKERLDGELADNVQALMDEIIALKKESESCRMASEQLGTSYRHLSEAMDGMKDAAIVVDSEGQITYLNREAKEFFREMKGDPVGKRLVDLPLLSDDVKFQDKYDIALSKRRDERLLLYSRASSRWFEIKLRPRDRDTLVYFRDVTILHATEELYKLTHFSINHILDVAIWIRPNGRFFYVNETACRSLGYPRDALIRMHFSDIVAYLPLNDWGSFWERVKKNASMIFESDVRDHAGGRYPAEISVNYIKFHDNECMVALVRDISERKRAERELMASKAQADAAREQAELYLDLMGHDITNINQIGMGYLEMALETLELAEEQKELLTRPLQSLQNSSRLIDKVRKLQRLKEGKIPVKVVDVGLIIKGICQRYAGLEKRRVTIDVSRLQRCNAIANDLLPDVFDNLIGNAIRHNEGDLAIGVEIEKRREGDRDYCSVTISDNGRGIPEKHKEKIFDRSKNTDYLTGGIGLGLHFAKTLIESYEGRIRVEDRVPGDYTKGAKFVVMIPSIE